MKLSPGDRVITAWAENCSGPGWSNRIVWILVKYGDQQYRVESLQPEEQTPEIAGPLFDISAATNRAMVGAVNSMLMKPSKRTKRPKTLVEILGREDPL